MVDGQFSRDLFIVILNFCGGWTTGSGALIFPASYHDYYIGGWIAHQRQGKSRETTVMKCGINYDI